MHLHGGVILDSFVSTIQHGVADFFESGTQALLSFAFRLVIAFIVWFVCYRLIRWFCKKPLLKILEKGPITHEVHHFIQTAVKVLLYVVLFVGIINILGFQTTSLVALIGGAAVAIGASLQGSLANFAGGILLLVFKPFKKGDYIIVGTNEGYVHSVNVLYTNLRTLDNKGITLPNGTLANSNVVNFHAEKERRLDVDFSVSFDQNVGELRDIIKAAMMKSDYVLPERGFVTVVKSLTTDGILVSNRAWIKSENFWPAYFQMQELVMDAIAENGIDIANSQLDIHIKSDETRTVREVNKEK